MKPIAAFARSPHTHSDTCRHGSEEVARWKVVAARTNISPD